MKPKKRVSGTLDIPTREGESDEEPIVLGNPMQDLFWYDRF